MTRRPRDAMSKEELLRELDKLEAAAHRHAATSQWPDRERLIHDLEVHQVQLETQNRDLREAQQRLEEARERYADLYDFAPVGYCTVDPEGRIRELNLTAAALFGAPRGELVGKPITSMLPVESRVPFAEHLARCRTERSRVTSEITVSRGPLGVHTVDVVSEPIVDHDGQVIAFRTSLVDISARKQLELDLRLLSQAGHALGSTLDRTRTLDTAARLVAPAVADLCMIDTVDDAGRLERPVVVFADPGKAVLADRMRALVPRPGWQSAQARVITSGEPILLPELSDEIRRQLAYDDREADTLRMAEIESQMVLPLTVRDRILGALTLATAGSGRRYTSAHLELARALATRIALALDSARLYEEARHAIAARDATLALVSHDLRSPLGVILMQTELLLRTAPDHATRGFIKSFDAIRRSAQRMRRLIQDLLDFASIETGRLSVERTRQAAAQLVDDVVDELRAEAAAKSLQLERELPAGDPLEVDCDRDRIEQVLANLVGNALKFTAAGGKIVVRAELLGAEIRISIADTGSGIAPDDLPHVFDRYWQARATARMGSGLGLAIAKGIVVAHGGRIWAESRLGSGSTFYFTLPHAAATRAPVDALAPAPARDVRPSGTVLVVDDDSESRDVLGEVLAQSGYEVAKAGNGVEALAYLHESPPPALVVLDLTMPVMDGWEFLAGRERDPLLRAIPVLVLSGQREAADRVVALHAGYLAKPVSADRLLDAVAHIAH
jgi:PAS domain S-box-containing protein